MDGYDIYRKLIFGTSLHNPKEKKRLRKKRQRDRKKISKKVTKRKDSDNEDLNNDNSCNEDFARRNSEDTQEVDKNELSHVNINGDDDEGNTEQPKKKKQKTHSVLELTKIRHEEVRHFRRRHHIYVEGDDVSEPIRSFEQLNSSFSLHSSILSNINKLGYKSPTPIQMQVIPLTIDERQVLACAPTGSGKTAAFLIPILHNLKGPQNVGYRALILVPTRELAKQIYQVCLQLAEGTNIRPHVIEKVKTIQKKPKITKKFDILISTPNRLIHLLQHEPPLVSLDKIQWLVVDESDKLFEAGKQGFRDQLATVYRACDSAQVKRAMFSATFSYDVEQWCKLNLDSVVSVSIGDRNTAVETIKQELRFVGCEAGKLLEFRNLKRQGLKPPVLIFVQSKERAHELFNELIYDGYYVDAIHADRTQLQRDNVVRCFRQGKIWVLICTELMARGIDFKGVNLVINYDFPPTAISYIHRIGRTGRAGNPGHAITFFTEADFENLRSIAQVMKNAGCEVPDFIWQIRKKKKQAITYPIKREKISTVPQYDIDKIAKKRNYIRNMKKRLRKKKKLPQSDIQSKNA